MSQRKGPPRSPTRSLRQQKRAERKHAHETVRRFPVDLASDRLAKAIRLSAKRVRAKNQGDIVFYLSVAEIVIAECMRLKPSSTTSDPFFERPGPTDPVTWQYQARITSFADTLYALRVIEGFDIFCKRLRDQEAQASFYEGFSARMFLELGYRIKVRPSTGIKGEDFDFIASKGDLTVNGEVTTLQGDSYSSETVLNALEKKRKQLPKEEPGVIFIVVPESWYEPGWRPVSEALREDAAEFCGKTRRINAIIVVSEEHETFGMEARGWLGFRFDPILHADPRNPVAELDDFFHKLDGGGKVKPEAQRLAEMESIRTDQNSEFFLWAEQFWLETGDAK
jgi:hypothetical protein